MNTRFAAIRDALGLTGEVDFHSLRRSYITHLIEDGWDPLFVQQQVGHAYGQTSTRPRRARRLPGPTAGGVLARTPGHSGLPAGCRSFLRDYENWLANRLTHLADHTHERVLRQFGRWHQLAKMRSKAKLGPLRPTAGTYAVNGFNRAVHFCDWLTRNQHALGQLSQTALDRYYCNLTPGLPARAPTVPALGNRQWTHAAARLQPSAFPGRRSNVAGRVTGTVAAHGP
jgi:hypothetical protein